MGLVKLRAVDSLFMHGSSPIASTESSLQM